MQYIEQLTAHHGTIYPCYVEEGEDDQDSVEQFVPSVTKKRRFNEFFDNFLTAEPSSPSTSSFSQLDDSSHSPSFEAQSQINALFRQFPAFLQQSLHSEDHLTDNKSKRIYIRKKTYFPVYRVVKSDLRRKYGIMLNNSINSGEMSLLRAFLNEYTTPDFFYHASVDDAEQQAGMPMLPSTFKFGSHEHYLMYIAGIRNTLPDFISKIDNIQLRTQNCNEKCQLEYDLSFHGTIVPKKLPGRSGEAQQSFQAASQLQEVQESQQSPCSNVSSTTSPQTLPDSELTSNASASGTSSPTPSSSSTSSTATSSQNLDKIILFAEGSFVSVIGQQPLTPVTPSPSPTSTMSIADKRAAMLKANKPIHFCVQARSILRINEERFITALEVKVLSTKFQLAIGK